MTRRSRPGRSPTLANPRTFGALASPHRLETIAALGDAKSASIAELARRRGRSPHSLSAVLLHAAFDVQGGLIGYEVFSRAGPQVREGCP